MDIRIACEKIKVFRQASPASLAAILSSIKLRKYRKKELIFRDKEQVTQFYFLVSGYISLYKISTTEEKKVVFLCSAGEMLNEAIIQNEVASIEAEALTDCEVLILSKKDLEQIMSYDYQLSRAVMESMAIKIRRLYHQLKNTPNSVRLDKQIAAKIWKLARDYGRERQGMTEIEFDITVSFLAEMVGSKRETVSRQVKLLIEQDLIRMEKRRIWVPDQEKLVKYVKES